jgi:hypothetical protein
MSFKYSQTTGRMTGENFEATGYSGNGEGLNNPAMQDVHAVGPLPQGSYTILAPHADPKVGPIAMGLAPAPGNEMFRRGDFLIHGDNPQMNHTASEGCIILPHDARVAIGAAVLAGDNQLEVTA